MDTIHFARMRTLEEMDSFMLSVAYVATQRNFTKILRKAEKIE